MTDSVQKEGVVVSVQGLTVRVRIDKTSGCDGCSEADHCHASQCRPMTIDIVTPEASTYSVGDRVVVSAARSVVYRALWAGFGIPLLLLVAVVGLCRMCGGDESWAALWSIGSLAVYYGGLYLMRSRIGASLKFRIERK